jgi:hypothetical protein
MKDQPVRYEAIVSAVLEETKAGWMVYFRSPYGELEDRDRFYRNKDDAYLAKKRWESLNDKIS